VKAIVVEKQNLQLRIPCQAVKALLIETAKQRNAEAFATMKFSRNYFFDAFRRMSLAVRSASSVNNIEDAALLGRFFCRSLVKLRQFGTVDQLGPIVWPFGFVRDSVFGYFPPETVWAVDEVPFNFAEDGRTAVVRGMDAAVRCLRGVGKRAGTAIICSSATGELSKVVLIFKRKTAFPEKDMQFFKQFKNVIVTHSQSGYVNESIWVREVIDKQIVQLLMAKYGRDWTKRWYLLVSDNHSSHQTQPVLDHCFRSQVIPVFTPAKCTPYWSLIDDYTGAQLRRQVYQKAEMFEIDYFEKNPKGDGVLSADHRRRLLVRWWDEAMSEGRAFQGNRVNAAKRVGLWVTAKQPADLSNLPCPVRFKGTPYQFFGERFYDPNSVDYNKETVYDFAFKPSAPPQIKELPAHDEDGHSHEEQLVVPVEEELGLGANVDIDEIEEADEDEDDEAVAEEIVVAKRPEERKAYYKNMAQEFADLQQVEKEGKEIRKALKKAREELENKGK
jgi:hypothetical protein